MNEVVTKENAEACLRQALMYFYQEKQMENSSTALQIAYNQAIGIVNDVYKNVGDTKLIKNDIVKLKQMRDILATLANGQQSVEVKYFAKVLATLLGELII